MDVPVPSRLERSAVTILSGASLSDALHLQGRTLVGIDMPASWTAASLSLAVSNDGSTYLTLYDAFGEVTFAAAASTHVGIDFSNKIGFNYLKVRSGSSGSPVNQAADRTIYVVTADMIR